MLDNLSDALVIIHVKRELMDDATHEVRDFVNLARGGVHDAALAREFLAAISGLVRCFSYAREESRYRQRVANAPSRTSGNQHDSGPVVHCAVLVVDGGGCGTMMVVLFL